ncbi:MAG: sigma 54-interacting transcriptional regulator [Deltaproteobacteria bacterium]
MSGPRRQLRPTITWSADDLLGSRSERTLRLVVIGPTATRSVTLPDSGRVRIGRADDNDLVLDDPAASREHALLHMGSELFVEDLGSANGTRLQKKALDSETPTPFAPGEVIEIGDTMLVVQRAPVTDAHKKLQSHAYFEARLADACDRGECPSVVRIRVSGDVDGVTLEKVMTRGLEIRESIGAFAAGEYELMLFGEAVGARVETLVGSLVPLGLEVDHAVATAPRDGRSGHALNTAVEERIRRGRSEGPWVFESEAILDARRLAERVAPTEESVLLLGETGVGKEVFADLIHRRSRRASGQLVKINCAALSQTLLESELFGHEKGAFTGADAPRAGLLESANGGTVFLDELGEMPLGTQAALLRAIAQREVVRVGSVRPRPIDVRFIAATNRDLEAEVAEGNFREDLYYRVNAFAIEIPPLRERVADIPYLVRSVLSTCAFPGTKIEDRALQLLEQYEWPGNIRELRNVVQRGAILSGGAPIDLEHLPVDKLSVRWTATTSPRPDGATQDPWLSPREREERQRIADALDEHGGNQTKAARALQIPRRTFTNKLNKYGFPRPRKRK